MKISKVAKFVIGSLTFGLLMAVRAEAQSIWLRALIAAVAGAVLGLMVISVRRN